MPTHRLRKFIRCLALAIAVPVVFFVGLEWVLRIAGIGHRADFVVRRTIEGKRTLTNNPHFGTRFFDLRRSRKASLFAVPEKKGAETIRVIILGGSAAMGDPYPSIGVSRMVETMLQHRYPEQRFEVVNAAMTAINSHVVRIIMRDCRRLKPDAVVIWMGNNEVIGPYGPASVFSPVLHKSPVWIRLSVSARGTRTGQLLTRLRHVAGRRELDLEDPWRGMEMFIQTSIGADDSRLDDVYAHFACNLKEITGMAQDTGAAVVLCTVPVNLGNCAPFGKTTDDADTQYRIAQTLEREQRYEDARVHYERARDLDDLRFRADTEINRLIRGHASARDSIRLVDAVSIFGAASMNGIPGENLFLDHVHPNFQGNYIMAHAVCRALEDALLENRLAADEARNDYATPEQCRRALVHTDWDAYRIADLMYGRMKHTPFTNQFDHETEMRRLSMRRQQVKPATQPLQMGFAINQYQQAITRRPRDWVLRDHLATLAFETGRAEEAREQIYAALRRYPYSAQLRARLAAALALTGETSDALRELRKSNPVVYSDKSAALEALAGALFEKGKIDDARYLYDRALDADPGRVSLHYHIGRMLILMGAPADAESHLRIVLKAAPDHARTHAQLGICLTQIGRRDEALQHLQRAVELTPLNAARRGNLGALLAEMGRIDEGIAQLTKAAKLDPASGDICNNLGYAFSRAGRHVEAAAWYREALLLAPGDPRIGINFADALFAAGERREAREVAQRALEQAKQAFNPGLVKRIHARLQAYGVAPASSGTDSNGGIRSK